MTWEPGLRLEDIKEELEYIDLFLPNDKEACMLTGADEVEEALCKIGNCCSTVVVTAGAKGCIAYREGTYYKAGAAAVGEPVDLTGAGDAFDAGFIFGYLNNQDILDCLRIASASGSLAVTYAGGMSHVFQKETVAEMAKKIMASQRREADENE